MYQNWALWAVALFNGALVAQAKENQIKREVGLLGNRKHKSRARREGNHEGQISPGLSTTIS